MRVEYNCLLYDGGGGGVSSDKRTRIWSLLFLEKSVERIYSQTRPPMSYFADKRDLTGPY